MTHRVSTTAAVFDLVIFFDPPIAARPMIIRINSQTENTSSDCAKALTGADMSPGRRNATFVALKLAHLLKSTSLKLAGSRSIKEAHLTIEPTSPTEHRTQATTYKIFLKMI